MIAFAQTVCDEGYDRVSLCFMFSDKSHMVNLTYNVRGRNQYINAVFAAVRIPFLCRFFLLISPLFPLCYDLYELKQITARMSDWLS